MLAEIGGSIEVYGLNNPTYGCVDSPMVKDIAINKLQEQNFKEVIE